MRKELKEKIYFWFGKRANSQYVDIKGNKLLVPHELFDEDDAQKALDDSKEIVDEMKELISNS